MKALYSDFFNFISLKSRDFFRKHSLPRWMVFAFDGSVVFVTFLFAYVLRFNFVLEFPLGTALRQGLVVVGVFSLFELIFRAFAGLIRHTTIKDIFNVLLTTTSTLAVLLVITLAGKISFWQL